MTLEIGPKKTKFVVHKDYACHYSPVLKAALNSQFIEGQTQTYTLEDVEMSTGKLLIHWFYHQSFSVLNHDDWELSGTDEESLALIQLWVLADKLLIPRLQNDILREIKRFQEDEAIIPITGLGYAYKHSSKDSVLRKFLLDLCACYMDPKKYSTEPDYFPKEMLLELVEMYATKLDVDDVEGVLDMGENWAQYEVAEPESS